MLASSSRSKSTIACKPSPVAPSRNTSGSASSQAAYSACSLSSVATAACHCCGRLATEVKAIFQYGEYSEILGFLQCVLRQANCPHDLPDNVEATLRLSRAAYSVIDRDTIIPIGSDAERETLVRAFADVAASEFHGARVHLRNAGFELTAGHYGPSIRESIHAVEAVARVLEPGANTLAPALSKLEKSIRIHHALRNGFGSLYGFTSDEKGIRHALLDQPVAQVDETDALYMLGSCAAFVSYLINKARQAGLL
jgi:predicted metal-binding protein